MTATFDRGRRRHHLLLRIFPKAWRADGRAEEALGVCLAVAEDEGREVLGTARALDLGWLAVRARSWSASSALPASSRRLLAAATFLAGVGLSTGLLMIEAWPLDSAYSAPHSTPPIVSLGTVIYGLWLALALVAVLGRERAVWVTTSTITISTLIAGAFSTLAHWPSPAAYVLTGLLMLSLVQFSFQPLEFSRNTRVALTAAAIIAGTGWAWTARSETTWPWTSQLVAGNPVLMASTGEAVLAASAVVILALLPFRKSRRLWVVPLLVNAGPWAVFALRGLSGTSARIHLYIAGFYLLWIVLVIIWIDRERRRGLVKEALKQLAP